MTVLSLCTSVALGRPLSLGRPIFRPSVHGERAQRLRGLEIDHKLEFARLHDRQVGRFRAFENLAGINTALTVAVGEVRCVTDETASFRKFTLMVHGRKLVARSKRNELIAMAGEERV